MAGIPAAPVEEPLVELAPEEEPVTPAEGEVVPALGPDEIEQPPADEGTEEDVNQAVIEFLKEHPELKDAAAETLGLKPPEEQLQAMQVEQLQGQWGGILQEKTRAASAYTSQGVAGFAQQTARRIVGEAKAGLKRFQEGHDEELNVGDPDTIAQGIAGYTNRAIDAAVNYAQAEAEAPVIQTLLALPAARYLNQEDLQVIEYAQQRLPSPGQRLAAIIPRYVAAEGRRIAAQNGNGAVKPDPEVVKAQEAAAAQAAKLFKLMKNNGSVAKNGATPSVGGRPTLAAYAGATAQQRKEWADKGVEPLDR